MLAVEHGESFRAINVVVLVGKLLPQLLAPFGYNSKDLRRFDDQMLTLDFVLGIGVDSLLDLPARLIMGVLLHLLPVFLALLHTLELLEQFFTC